MQNPTLAIVIPAYKHQFLRETLESIAGQTCKDFNLYIGDDGSPNPIGEIVEGFRGRLDFVYKRFDKNLGGKSLVGHWKRCIEMTQGEEWLMILGDDDIISENHIERFYFFLNQKKLEGFNLVRFSSCEIDEKGFEISETYKHPEEEDSKVSFFRKIYGNNRSSVSEHIFKKKAYDAYGFREYPVAWHSDDMAWLEFTKFGRIFSINDAIVKVRKSSESISGSINNLGRKNQARLMFYRDLTKDYINKFSQKDAIYILNHFEHLVFGVKKNQLLNWFYLAKGFLSLYLFKRAMVFTAYFAINFFKTLKIRKSHQRKT